MRKSLRDAYGKCLLCGREYDEVKEVCRYCECDCGRAVCEECDINLDLTDDNKKELI